MPKIPYKTEKTLDDDDDYEIVSFEDFCDKSPGTKTDLLTLNDNINYRLCYETEKSSKFAENDGETSSRDAEKQTETSLDGLKDVSFKRRLSGSFAPFGRSNGKTGKGSLFGGMIPKSRSEGDSGSREQHRYQRFSSGGSRWWWRGMGPGIAGTLVVVALCVAVWYMVCGILGADWGEDHYRKLWEKTHPDNVKKPLSPIPYEKINPQQILPEYRYHDHNNLSTKNKNGTEAKKRPDLDKKSDGMTFDQIEELREECVHVPDDMRFDCYPTEERITMEMCEKRGCCWRPTTVHGPPHCFYPARYSLYKLANMSESRHGVTAYYARTGDSGYPRDFNSVALQVKYLSADSVQVKIYDADNKRFEVPIPDIPMVPGPLTNLTYRVQIGEFAPGFKVIRNSDNVTIVNTADVGPMILSDKFLQFSSQLPSANVFGLGEHRARFKRNINWKTYTMFNKDQPPADNMNMYGTHPFYMSVETNGKAHGMLLLNSNAMDVAFQPTPALTYRTIGGVLNLLIMAGPTPQDVVRQYTALIGRPFMPPYWALGFHLCKYGYNSLNTTRHVWKTNRDAGIPFDVQWNDIDYMVTQNDFTYDTERYGGLPEFVDKLHAEGMHYVPILDPGVSASEKPGTYPPYDRGLEMDVFVKNSTNQPFVAKVWNPVSTVYPDFTHPNSTAYWVEMMTSLHHKIKYDGVWIDMNEPSNFLNGQMDGECAPEDLPYKPVWLPKEGLKYKTLCMDAKHHLGAHYDIHNLYGLTEAVATNFALKEIRGKRPFIISRSSFPGLGQYAGHWSGDISSTWDDMRMTIPVLLSFSLFGVPMMGSDICGFGGNTTVELCMRWMQLGAFYPFSRNHNDVKGTPQDPVSLGPSVVEAGKRALRLRYALLPHYYTLFWRAHVSGDAVAQPLFFESPSDPQLLTIDDQFLIGPSLLISPILQPGATATEAMFPGKQRWYNIQDGLYICSDKRCRVTEDEMVAVKGGAIIPLQEPSAAGPVTTTNSRSGPLQLLVVPDSDLRAAGDLYWDDGDSLNSYEERKYSHIEFSLSNDELRSTVDWWGFGVPSLNNITVLNLRLVKTVTVNGAKCEKPHCDFEYISDSKLLRIYTTLSLDHAFTIKWTYSKHHKFDEDKKIFRNRVPIGVNPVQEANSSG